MDWRKRSGSKVDRRRGSKADGGVGLRRIGGWWVSVTSSFGGGDIDDGRADGGKQSELERLELRE